MWLIFCKRPLTLTELAVAIAVNPTDKRFDETKKFDDDEQVLEICSSFVKMDEQTHIVEVGHFSVVEYFTCPRLPNNTENPDFMDEVTCNAKLLNCCLTYLTFPQFERGSCDWIEITDLFRDNELLEYSAQHWRHHADVIKTERILQDSICAFFGRAFQNHFLSWSAVWQARNYDPSRPPNPHGMYYAVKFRLDYIFEFLLNDVAGCRGDRTIYSHTLLAAAERGAVKIGQDLLSLNADIAVVDMRDRTALHLAASEGHTEIAKLLLDAGADVNVKGDYGRTPLLDAASRGHTEIAKLLLDAGADVNVKGDYGRTPLHDAASGGHTEIAKLLLDAGADVNVKDDSGRTPLHDAASRGHTEIAKLLLDAGADVNVKGDYGRTPLHHAASRGHTEIAKLLLDAGADVNVKDDYGWTPLHHAASRGHTEIAKLLLDAGADVNVKDDSGWTPLHDAASEGHTEIAKLLLDAGADVNVKNNYGRTPLL